MPKLGEIVFYKMQEAPQVYYPAIITRVGSGDVSLTVFTEEGQLFLLKIKRGLKGEPGTYRFEEDEPSV